MIRGINRSEFIEIDCATQVCAQVIGARAVHAKSSGHPGYYSLVDVNPPITEVLDVDFRKALDQGPIFRAHPIIGSLGQAIQLDGPIKYCQVSGCNIRK